MKKLGLKGHVGTDTAWIYHDEISKEEIDKLREITVDSALNTPDTLPKPILNKLIAQALNGVWSAEDCAMFNEKKSNMNFVWNFLRIVERIFVVLNKLLHHEQELLMRLI